MSDKVIFIDSNIWLYRLLADQDPDPQEDARKRGIAIALTEREGIIVSTQIINEVCSVLIRRGGLNDFQILDLIEDFETHCTIIELTTSTLKQAANLRIQYNFSFWDSLIVSTALSGGASILYSEDMQDSLLIAHQLKIVNPFK
ncbi:twitching motility protein PilT [[Phormidium ambiguum] IAM M-71]|uniref:Twitching motility protein PilT n=1 Tax=[Phormidium ambiguum] IAM M-71 TaxID=454136 RepID=A0A1U7I5S6_9CYAN|nr:PIN domain-containing protein [Phormidium ambiguum]OKH31631.1 twitching motility protein PilT [Phormidium ambiguum IAM M-71]